MRSISTLALLFAIVTLANAAQALTTTWDGSGGSAWATPSSWSNGVPGAADVAIIPGGLGTYPVVSAGANVNTLNVKNGATLTLTGGILTVQDGGFAVEGGGTFIQSDGIVEVHGSWSQGGIVSSTGGKVRFAGNHNIDLAGKAIVYSEDFSTGGTGWTFNGDWSRSTPASGFSGPTAPFDGRALCYNNGARYTQDTNNLRLTSLYPNYASNNNRSPDRFARSPAIARPAGVTDIDLEFRRWLAVENSSTAQAQVIVSSVQNPTIGNIGTNWAPVFWESNSGYSANNDAFWKRTTINLQDALIDIGSPNTFYILFNMGYVSDNSNNLAGLHVDDVRILIPGDVSSFFGLEIATTSQATVRANSAIEIRGDLTVFTGSRFDLGSFTHQIHGDFANLGGTIIVNDSVVEFVGSGDSYIGGNGTAAAIEPSFLYTETFNSGNGGYSQTNVVPGASGASEVWTYDASGGRSGTGAWRMDGWNTGGSNRCRKDLTSSAIAIAANTTNLRLTYWHNFDTEQDYDHYMLEYSVGGGAFNPVPYSRYLLGEPNGYVGQFTPSGRGDYGVIYEQHEAWTGTSNGFARVIVDIDSLVVAKPTTVRFRFRYEQDSSVANAGVRIDDLRIIGASTTVVGNGLFDMVVRKDNPNLSVIVNTSMEVMNDLTLDTGILEIANGPAGEFLVGGNDLDNSTPVTVGSGTQLNVTSGNFISDSTGEGVTRLRVENGGEVNVDGGTLQLGPSAGQDENFNGSLELLAGGVINVDGGTLLVENPQGNRRFDISLDAGEFNLISGTVETDGDFILSGNADFNMSGGTLEIFDDLLINGGDFNTVDGDVRLRDDWTKTAGVFSDTGASWEFFGTANATVNTNDAEVALHNVRVNKSGRRLRLNDPLNLSGDFHLDSGEFDHNAADHALNIEGDLTIDAGTTYTKREATVTLDGVDQGVTTNGAAFWDFDVENTGLATFNDGLMFCDSFEVDSGSSAVVTSGTLHADTSVASAIVLDGRLQLDSGTTVRMQDNTDIVINSGGSLVTKGTDPDVPANRVTFEGETPGVDDFQILVNNGATLNMKGAYVCDGTVESTPTPNILSISNSEFCSLPNGQGDAFIDIAGVTGGLISFRNLGFERGSRVSAANARNILADASTKQVTVGGYSGDLSGESWDNDPTNNVLWSDERLPFGILDVVLPEPIYSLAELFEHLPQAGGTVTIISTYVVADGGRQYVAPTFNEIHGRTTIPAFNGTLNIDGFAFYAGDDGIALDLTNASAQANVNLFNCSIADPERPGGARAVAIDGAANLTADFCTIDSSNLGTSGFSSATNSIFATAVPASHFVDYGSRNLRLTAASAGSYAAVRNDVRPRDIDGKFRAIATTRGCHYYYSDIAKKVQIIDIADTTNGTSRKSAVIYNSGPSQNSIADVAYINGSDGTNVYVSIISRETSRVLATASFAGSRTSFSTFSQTTDNENLFWVYVPYDSNNDGSLDRIRKILHTQSGASHSFGSQADIVLRNKSGAAIDFMSAGGWSGQIFIQNGHHTRRFGEFQVAIATPANNGEVHTFFVNPHSSSGLFFNGPDFAQSDRAAESFVSNAGSINFNLNPNLDAVPLLYGSKENGHISLVRYRDGSNSAAMVQINRANGQIQNSFTGPGMGGTLSTEPVRLFQTAGMGAAAHTDSARITEFDIITWASQRTLDLNLPGYGAPSGVLPFGWFVSKGNFFTFYNEDTGTGAIAAVEYDYRNNGNNTLDLLTGAYSGANNRYNGAGFGGFYNGIALVRGQPTAVIWSPIDKTALVSTTAGLIYGWTASGIASQETAATKGFLHPGFPVRVPGGRVTDISYVAIDDAGVQNDLNMSGSGTAIAAFNDIGQMLLIRSPGS